MKFKCRFWSILLVLCIVLAGCGDSKSDLQGSTKESQSERSIEETTEVVEESASAEQEETEVVTEETEENKEAVITEIDRYVIKADVLACLDDELIEYYKKAMDAVFARETEVKLSDSWDDNLLIMSAMMYNPYAFLLEEYDVTDDHKSIYLKYAYSAKEQQEMIDFMDNEYLGILNGIITEDMNELEKVLAVYHYFASTITYDYDWLDGLNMSDDKFLYPDIEIYEALKTNQGVCHTYTYLCEFALQQLGVECLRVSAQMANEDSGHMWLVVKIDGEYYHFDPTWDSNYGQVGLKYFGMTDEECLNRGVLDYSSSYDEMYGKIVCDDTRFSEWRDVYDYYLNYDHTITLYRKGVDDPQIEQLN